MHSCVHRGFLIHLTSLIPFVTSLFSELFLKNTPGVLNHVCFAKFSIIVSQFSLPVCLEVTARGGKALAHTSLSPGWETDPKDSGEVATKSVEKYCWFRWRGKCSSWPVCCSVNSKICPECSSASFLDRGDAARLFRQDSLFLSSTLWKAWPDLDWEAWWNINTWCLLNIVNILPRHVNK